MADDTAGEFPSTVNKEFLQVILNAIDGGELPKQAEILVDRQPVHKRDPYLTLGKNVSHGLLPKLEEMWKSAYKMPGDTSPLYAEKRRTRGNFRSLHTYRSRLDIFKLERLFIADDIKLPGRSITEDIDPEYYSVVGGRPIKESTSLAEHKCAVKSTILTRLDQVGIEALLAEMKRKQAREVARFKRAETSLVHYSELFDQFLEEDYQTSADLLAEADEACLKTQEMEKRKTILEKEVETLQSRVVLLEEQWRVCKMHQQFLYSVAPLPWRRLHDYIHQKEGAIDPTEVSLFRKIRGASLTAKDEMSSKISRFLGETRTCSAPALYFTQPQQLFSMFRDLEERNLSSMVQCEQLQPSVLTMHKAKEKAEADFAAEIAAVTEEVEELRREVAEEEGKAKKLEKETRMVCNDHLQPLMSNKKTISLTASLERAYEMVFGRTDNNLNLVEMMRGLESAHESLQMKLDLMPSDLVGRVMQSWEKEHARQMTEERIAANKVHRMEMLRKRHENSLKPWKRRPIRRPVFRSQPPPERKVRKPPPPILTVEEMERRVFFGEDQEENDLDHIYRPMC